MGMFYDFIEEERVQLVGVEAAGQGLDTKEHAASLTKGSKGILHGACMYILQDEAGQVEEAHSISAGLDYPGIGPEHAYLYSISRVKYDSVTDFEAVEAFKLLTELEGIIPALESSHAVAYATKISKNYKKDDVIVVCLSGRGDKDIDNVLRYRGELV